MTTLEYSELYEKQAPEVVYVETSQVYCCGLGNVVLTLCDLSLTVLFIATLPIAYPAVILFCTVMDWRDLRAKKEKQKVYPVKN